MPKSKKVWPSQQFYTDRGYVEDGDIGGVTHWSKTINDPAKADPNDPAAGYLGNVTVSQESGESDFNLPYSPYNRKFPVFVTIYDETHAVHVLDMNPQRGGTVKPDAILAALMQVGENLLLAAVHERQQQATAKLAASVLT